MNNTTERNEKNLKTKNDRTPTAPMPQVENPEPQAAEGNDAGGRPQLRRRVEARMQELEAALERLGGDGKQEARIHGLETELQAARDNIGGGWEHVGAVEAAQLSRWLERTEFLAADETAQPTRTRPQHDTIPELPSEEKEQPVRQAGAYTPLRH